MNSADTIDVVIVNYNSGQALEQCLRSLNVEKNSKINVVVVDNHSSDDSLAAIEAIEYPIKILKNSENRGFAKACNQGAQYGQSNQIAMINPDCFINDDQLFQLSAQLINHKNAALVGCRVLNQDGGLQAATRRRLPTFWRTVMHMTRLGLLPFIKGININDNGQFESVKTVEAVNGACFIINRSDFEQLGGYDEVYPLHFEDLDLFARIKRIGKDVIYDSSVEVIHLHGHSSQDNAQIKAWKQQGLVRYMYKHRPKWEYQIVKFLLGAK